MYSSEDLEKFYFDYQSEWMPRGMSIQAYCSRNNVPYKILDRWIKGIYKRVVPVEVTGIPEGQKEESPQQSEPGQKNPGSEKVSIRVNIITSTGMRVSKEGLDYGSLRMFIEKLEYKFPRLRKILADGGYQGSLGDRVFKKFGWVVEVVLRPDECPGKFQVMPIRWIVERTFSWLENFRRLTIDYKFLAETAEAMVRPACVRIMLNRFFV